MAKLITKEQMAEQRKLYNETQRKKICVMLLKTDTQN